MKKYSLFSRIFNWKKIYEEILLEGSKDSFLELSMKEKDIENLNQKISFLEKNLEDFKNEKNSQIKTKDEALEIIEKNNKKLNNDILVLSNEKTELKTNLANKEKEISKLKNIEQEKLLLEKDKKYLDENVEKLKNEISNLIKEKTELKTNLENSKKNIDELKRNLDNKKEKINKLTNVENENSVLKKDIGKAQQQLENLKETNNKELKNNVEKIDQLLRIFNRSEGTKGKLGEIALQEIFEKIDPDKKIWITDLAVEKNRVEFAMKTIVEDKIKYIPIDSKVITGGQDTNNEILINDKFISALRAQVKKVNTYVGKSNTTNFAILVLSSDDIYSKLFDYDSNVFGEAIEEFNVSILSPSTFFQFALTTKYTISLYEKVKNESKVLDEVGSLIKTINNFVRNVDEGYKKLSLAIDKQLPVISRKAKKLKIGELEVVSKDDFYMEENTILVAKEI